MRCAIVSGITGHLGHELARQLVKAGVRVHGLTRGNVENPCLQLRGQKLHHIDGTTERLIQIFDEVRPDCVFHLAALARREHDFYNVAPFINANILFGTQLLESMRLTECRRMITAGSYLQHVESGECRPFNLYAATKQAFENLLTFYVDVYDVSATLLILCNIYGEDDLRPTLMTDIAAASVTGSTLHLHAREVWIDPVHVEDAAGAFLRAAHIMEDDSSPNGTLTRYSVSSGGYISATELINIFECLSKKRLTVNRATLTSPSRRTKPWSGAFVPGWVPRVEIEAGLSRLLAKQRDKQAMP